MKREAVSKRVRFLILQRDGFTCQYCGARAPDVELQVDHIHPVAAGGTVELDNLVTSCTPCNAGKSARHLIRTPRAGAWIPTPDPLDFPDCIIEHGLIPAWIPEGSTELTPAQLSVCEAVADADLRAFNRSLHAPDLDDCDLGSWLVSDYELLDEGAFSLVGEDCRYFAEGD